MTRILSILALLVLIACSNPDNANPIAQQVEEDSTGVSVVIETYATVTEMSTHEANELIRQLVSAYSESSRHGLPNNDEQTRKAMSILGTHQPDSLNHYLAWLFAKKYRFQLECCNQGYELRSLPLYSNRQFGIDSIADPWVFEFIRSSELIEVGQLLSAPYEFLNSGMVVQWLDSNPELVRDEVKSEKTQIDSLTNRIENRLPWK